MQQAVLELASRGPEEEQGLHICILIQLFLYSGSESSYPKQLALLDSSAALKSHQSEVCSQGNTH